MEQLHVLIVSPFVLAPIYATLTLSNPWDVGMIMTKVLISLGLLFSVLAAAIYWQRGRWPYVVSLFIMCGFAISCFLGWQGLFCMMLFKTIFQ